MAKIYESPDNGKTIYERDFGNYKDRKLVKTDPSNQTEVRKFNQWRKEKAKDLPNISKRVFALRNISYKGSGFHWSLEAGLGRIIHMLNDYGYDSGYRNLVERLVAKARYEVFIKRLEKIEMEVNHE